MARRRDVLLLLALAAAPLAAFRLYEARGAGGFDFAPIPGAPGFRSLDGGAVSATGDPFVGIGAPQASEAPGPLAMDDLCNFLFGGPVAEEVVPVAYFSDYNCPYCGQLSARMREREAAGLDLTWHELPLLGPGSEAAARAALAARRQDAYPQIHARLMRAAFQPTEAYVSDLARGLGLDAARLIADMRSASVTRDLDRTRAAANRLGIFATPTLVVGRTVVTGLVSEARLDALIQREGDDGPLPC